MKKIFATILCLAVTTPCFAAGHHSPYGRGYDNGYHGQRPPRMEKRCNNNYYYVERRSSKTTKTLATVAGVAGIAAIISAIVD